MGKDASIIRSAVLVASALALVGASAPLPSEGPLLVAGTEVGATEVVDGPPESGADPLACLERVRIPTIDNAIEASWSPDGTHLAFTRIVPSPSRRTVTGYEEDPGIAILDLTTGAITTHGEGTRPQSSASGQYLSFWRRGHLFILRAGRNIAILEPGQPEVRWVGEQLVSERPDRRPAEALGSFGHDGAVSRPLLISVIGKSARDPGDPVPPQALAAAEEVGRLIAHAGAVAVTGGLSGVMEAVSRGAKSADGLVIGVLPGFDKRDANAYVDIAFTAGMGFMRNTLTVRAADAVIMISGGIGTLNELTVAYHEKPTVILEGTGGWSDRVREIAYDGKHLDERANAPLHFAQTPTEAVDTALALAADASSYPKGAEKEFQT